MCLINHRVITHGKKEVGTLESGKESEKTR